MTCETQGLPRDPREIENKGQTVRVENVEKERKREREGGREVTDYRLSVGGGRGGGGGGGGCVRKVAIA